VILLLQGLGEDPDALTALGELYIRSAVVPRDIDKARDYLQRAEKNSKQGSRAHSLSQTLLQRLPANLESSAPAGS
jgi:TPR repeat protein